MHQKLHNRSPGQPIICSLSMAGNSGCSLCHFRQSFRPYLKGGSEGVEKILTTVHSTLGFPALANIGSVRLMNCAQNKGFGFGTVLRQQWEPILV